MPEYREIASGIATETELPNLQLEAGKTYRMEIDLSMLNGTIIDTMIMGIQAVVQRSVTVGRIGFILYVEWVE